MLHRARRHVFTILSALSLLLCMATCVLWVRSYRTVAAADERDHISFKYDDPLWWIISYPGTAMLCRQTGHDWDGHELPKFSFMGVGFGGTRGPTGDLLWNFSLPYWLICVATLVLPLIELRRRWREGWKRRREQRGLCVFCGYDLRASPERCPECGAVREDDKVTR